MTSVVSITLSAHRPDNAADNTAAHQLVLDELNEFARQAGWSGAAIEYYGIRDCTIIVTVIAGGSPVTIDDLRTYKEDRRQNQTEG